MGIDAVRSTMPALLMTLPNCRCLHISIAGDMKYWTAHETKQRTSVVDRMSHIAEDILAEVMRPLRSLGELQDVRLSLPSWLYKPWKTAIEGGEIPRSVRFHPNAPPGFKRLEAEEAWGEWCANGFWVMSVEINDFY